MLFLSYTSTGVKIKKLPAAYQLFGLIRQRVWLTTVLIRGEVVLTRPVLMVQAVAWTPIRCPFVQRQTGPL